MSQSDITLSFFFGGGRAAAKKVWTGAEYVGQCTGANFSVVASPSEVWYLDHAENKWNVM